MAKSEALKIRQSEERQALVKSTMDLVTKVVGHPITLGVIGFYLSDRLQGDYMTKTPYLGEYKGQPAWITEKYWDPNAGKLNGGAAVAMQAAIGAYMSAPAIASVMDIIPNTITAIKG